LQRRLSRMLVATVLATGILASLAAFYFAYDEAQELQDDTLRQVAALSVHQHTSARVDRQQIQSIGKTADDAESPIEVYYLPSLVRPVWLSETIAAGFHTLINTVGHESMRVFVRDAADGGRLVVAQSTISRNETALNSGLRTLIPSLLVLPLLIVAIAFILRGEFRALKRLSESLDQQSARHLQPLPEQNLPDEIIPFVAAINRLLLRINRMMDEQHRFIADAAHELRTPLAALSLQVQNLATADSPEMMHTGLIPLQPGIERARKLTVQLLDLAKIQAASDTREDINLSAQAREWIAAFMPLAEAKQIDLGIDEANLMSIRADVRAMGMIVKNALDNAIKYTPRGGEVTLRLRHESSNTLIEIIDSGPGIPAAKLGSVFAPFHRLSDVTAEGSGLGLAIAREAANKIGGTVQVKNHADGVGLVFTLKMHDQN